MATLVLTVAGGLIGGPLGAAIGATLGRSFDSEVLFRPKGRQGPRLSDLSVQTSSYGSAIPALFGTLRVAGTVIWSTDLIETRGSAGGGKGQPKVTTYSYSASFAVLLSARTIQGIGRIWADGKLLRGAAGDFKSQLGAFRWVGGGEDQAVDPLIAASEGAAKTPAHRGCAYAVFEELELADFGNRIPSLTFEVIADAAAVDMGSVAETVSGGVVTGASGFLLDGFSAYGDDRRAVIEPLAEVAGCWFAPGTDGVTVQAGSGDAVTLADAGVHGEGKEARRGVREIASAASLPDRVTVRHYDPARDYQAGLQRAVRPDARGGKEQQVSLAAALSAVEAKQAAEAILMRADVGRETRRLAVGWANCATGPGARVRIAGESGSWRVTQWSLEAMVLTLTLSRIAPPPSMEAASSGQVSSAPDRVVGKTVLAAFELPLVSDMLLTMPRIGVAAAGEGAGWRSAALTLSEDGGTTWQAEGATALPAVIGTVVTPPGAGSAWIEDRFGMLEVDLAHAAMVLGQADRAALLAGANAALVGDELLQFGAAEQIAERRWRLSALWRGRRGTEDAIGGQVAGDPFILLDAEALRLLDIGSGRIGGVVKVAATGVADNGNGPEVSVAVTGRSLVPPSPVHLQADHPNDGGVQLSWVRRSRTGWTWRDGVDVPLGEATERYRVTLTGTDGTLRAAIETDTPALMIDSTMRGTGVLNVAVQQIGDNGLSLPAQITLG